MSCLSQRYFRTSYDIVQETGIKNIPMEKKCKKAKWLSGEALQIAAKRTEAKSKGEKERYEQLNAEFQRIARRVKKAVFSDQCKEIEENNKMGKTRDLFKKIKDTRRLFHAKLGSIKDRNMDEFICFCPPTIVEILRLQMVSRNHLLNHFHREDSSDSLKTIRIFLSRDRYRY